MTNSMPPPSVSVVIPTTGRPTLVRAVRSAVRQDLDEAAVEVVVVFDGLASQHGASASHLATALAPDLAARPDASLSIRYTGGALGGGAARAIGTEACRGAWVAYLDDDDWWAPTKLRRQLGAATAVASPMVLVSCRVRSHDGDAVRTSPLHLYDGRDMADYLFYRRRLASDRSMVHTSTLLLPAALAREVGWDTGLARHQDWDFVIRVAARSGVEVIQLEEPLVDVEVNSSGSVSASADWTTSLRWFEGQGGLWPPRARADFLFGQVLRYGIQARSATAIGRTLRQWFGLPLPTVNALLLALGGTVPRRALGHVMHARGRVV